MQWNFAMYQELLEMYFPQVEEDKRVMKTAAKVGLQLPKMYSSNSETTIN
jgi:hypothetical protein